MSDPGALRRVRCRAMDTGAYLARIGYAAGVGRDLETLEALQRAHLTAVPFENLDVVHRRGVHTDPARSVAKIVDRRRGGWCYELNGAFHALLSSLGFEARLLGTVEDKGFLTLDCEPGPAGGRLTRWQFHRLPARPMVTVRLAAASAAELEAVLAHHLASVPQRTVVRLVPSSPLPTGWEAMLRAGRLRQLLPADVIVSVRREQR